LEQELDVEDTMSGHLQPTQFRLIEERAEEILARFEKKFVAVRHPPVPVKMIAERLLKLRCAAGEPGYLKGNGVGSLSLGERLVLVDQRLNPREHRFAIAHEIGHRVLHEPYPDPSIDAPFRRVLSSGVWRRDEKGANHRETEAKRFAAALLVPRRLLYAEVEKFERINAVVVRKLAETFGVSELTMLIRIENLCDNLHWEGPPVDWDSLDWRKEGWMRVRAGRQESADSALATSATLPASPGQLSLIDVGEAASPPAYLLTRIRHKLRESDRPFVIEFSGMPRAGKDRQIGILRDYLQDVHDYRVGVLEEAIALCPMLTSSELDRFHWTVPTVVSRLLETVLDRPRKYDVVILNRGLFDTLTFLHLMRLQDRINDDKESVLVNFLLYEEWTCLIDAVLLLLISPSEALRREKEQARMAVRTLYRRYDGGNGRFPSQSVKSRKTLTQLSDAYRYTYTTYGDRFKAIHLLDFFESDPGVEEVAQEVIALIRPSLVRQQPLPGFARRSTAPREPEDVYQLAFPELSMVQ
jgi:hypothetical protein